MSALIGHAQNVAGHVGNQLHYTARGVGNQLQYTTDRLIPPKQREQKIRELRRFANRNPKLATFLAAQAALTGLPLLLFFGFGISTLFVSLTTCLLFALSSAFIYTTFVVGIALLFLIPTLIVASCAASCFFLGGLVVYFILQRFNEGEAPTTRGTRVGDRLQALTRGRLGRLVEGTDEVSVEVDKASDTPREKVRESWESGLVGTQQGVVGHVNGHRDGSTHELVPGPQPSVALGEWEEKWVNGTQQRQ